MIDQGIRQKDNKNGVGHYFAYGGDFGEVLHDGQFCINVSFRRSEVRMQYRVQF